MSNFKPVDSDGFQTGAETRPPHRPVDGRGRGHRGMVGRARAGADANDEMPLRPRAGRDRAGGCPGAHVGRRMPKVSSQGRDPWGKTHASRRGNSSTASQEGLNGGFRSAKHGAMGTRTTAAGRPGFAAGRSWVISRQSNMARNRFRTGELRGLSGLRRNSLSWILLAVCPASRMSLGSDWTCRRRPEGRAGCGRASGPGECAGQSPLGCPRTSIRQVKYPWE